MIPVLYDAKTTTFNTMGIGPLSEAISCVVTEERNGIFELELTYPVSGKRFKALKTDRIIVAKASKSNSRALQAFRIYLVSKPLNGKIKVYARHISYQLNNIIVGPFKTFVPATCMNKMYTESLDNNPFTFYTNITTDAEDPTTTEIDPNTESGDIVDERDYDYAYNYEWYAPIRERILGTTGSFLDIWGGEVEWDNYRVVIHENRGSDKGVSFIYGSDILDMVNETDISDLVTKVFPYYRKETYENLTEEEISQLFGDFVPVDESGSWRTKKKVAAVVIDGFFLSTNNVNKFSYPRTIMLDLTDQFDSVPTKVQLQTLASAYLTMYGVKRIHNEIDVVPTDKDIELCDTVHIDNPYLNVSLSAKVIKTEWDVLGDKYNKIEIADVADIEE